MRTDELQTALYNKLTGDANLMALITGVYVDVQQPDLPEDDANFPYLTFGGDNVSNWDTKTNNGASAVCQIDTWSRTNNFMQAKLIANAIYNALHNQSLTFSTAEHVLTVIENQNFLRDPNGTDKHGVTLVRVFYDQI